MILFLFISLGPGFDLALPRTHVSGVARLVMAAAAAEASPEEDHAAHNAVNDNLDKVMVRVVAETSTGMHKIMFWLSPTTPLSRLIDVWCTRHWIPETTVEFIYIRPATSVSVSVSGQETVATLEPDYEQKNQIQILAKPRFLKGERNDNY